MAARRLIALHSAKSADSRMVAPNVTAMLAALLTRTSLPAVHG
jgi:hypothetical protein